MTQKELERTAYHEAGHVVIALHFGMPLRWVSIEPAGECMGHTLIHPERPAGTPRELREEIVFSLVGYQAEIEFDPSVDMEDGYIGADESDALEAVSWYPVRRARGEDKDEAYDRYLERFRGETLRLVRQLWPAIQMVACELLKHETVTGDEVKALVGHMVR
jgi:ATP-dependent Zn protease